MNLKLNYPKGATPLDPDEIAGLIPDFITTQSELNALEQKNILDGKNWLDSILNKNSKEILSESFTRNLHDKMFNEVWRWSGRYRVSAKSIGIVEASQISTEVHTIMENTKSWIEFEAYSWPEIMARFHHRLVHIHPFPNGNGRYSRLHTEALAMKNNQPIPTWGEKQYSGQLSNNSEIRNKYIEALQLADARSFNQLVHFLFS